jgi:hypothetical protein
LINSKFISLRTIRSKKREEKTGAQSLGNQIAGVDPGFQVRGVALKKIAPSRGRRKNCWGISCEKSRFYAKK